MIRLLTTLAIGIGAGTLAAVPERTAFFSTGDRLPCSLDACEGSELVLSSPVLAEPARVDLSKLLEIRGERAGRVHRAHRVRTRRADPDLEDVENAEAHSIASSEALPPTAEVLIVSVLSCAKRCR